MRKLILLFAIIISSFFFSGCDGNTADIVFSTMPFTQETNYKPQNIFHKGERIYFAIYNGKGFKTRLLKFQVFKKESDKSEFWGYEYLYNRTVELTNKNAYTDYVVINNTGYYVFQIFDYTDFLKPVIIGIIKVVE